MEKNIVMVLLGYFLIAAIVSVAASGIVGLVLTNVMVRRFTKADRPIKIACASEVNEDLEPAKVAQRTASSKVTNTSTSELCF
jgi:multidrug efflux pump subunit AcrB